MIYALGIKSLIVYAEAMGEIVIKRKTKFINDITGVVPEQES